MVKILCLETATTNCSVTLSENESVIAFREDKSKDYSHAERLHVFIEEVLKEGQIGLNEISAIAISKGPGSYTGLRIGVSAAKGLCYALGIPLISIPTLQSLAMQVDNNSDFIVPSASLAGNAGPTRPSGVVFGDDLLDPVHDVEAHFLRQPCVSSTNWVLPRAPPSMSRPCAPVLSTASLPRTIF